MIRSRGAKGGDGRRPARRSRGGGGGDGSWSDPPPRPRSKSRRARRARMRARRRKERDRKRRHTTRAAPGNRATGAPPDRAKIPTHGVGGWKVGGGGGRCGESPPRPHRPARSPPLLPLPVVKQQEAAAAPAIRRRRARRPEQRFALQEAEGAPNTPSVSLRAFAGSAPSFRAAAAAAAEPEDEVALLRQAEPRHGRAVHVRQAVPHPDPPALVRRPAGHQLQHLSRVRGSGRRVLGRRAPVRCCICSGCRV